MRSNEGEDFDGSKHDLEDKDACWQLSSLIGWWGAGSRSEYTWEQLSFSSSNYQLPTTSPTLLIENTMSDKNQSQPIPIDTSSTGRRRSNSLWSNPGLSPSSSPLSATMSALQTPSSFSYASLQSTFYRPIRATPLTYDSLFVETLQCCIGFPATGDPELASIRNIPTRILPPFFTSQETPSSLHMVLLLKQESNLSRSRPNIPEQRPRPHSRLHQSKPQYKC